MTSLMTNGTRPPVAPVEGHYALLQNGMVARPRYDDDFPEPSFYDTYIEIRWFLDGRCMPIRSDPIQTKYAQQYDIIATISPEAMALAAVTADGIDIMQDGPTDTVAVDPSPEGLEEGGCPRPITSGITNNRIAHLEALIPLADAVLDHADKHCRWFDISTAPKDGTLIQLLVTDDNFPIDDNDEHGHITIGSWVDASERSPDEPAWDFVGWNWSHDCWTAGDGTPTHWRPLPPPPSNPPLPAVFVELGLALEQLKEGK